MINIRRLLKAVSVWMSIVYIICYVGVAIYPPIRGLFMKYALHADLTLNTDFLGFGYFFSGLMIWNIVVVLSVWLFVRIYNRTR